MLYEHDGCKDCKYEHAAGEDFPCSECKGTVIPSSETSKARVDYWLPGAGVNAVYRPEPVVETVNHPAHYKTNKFECIDVMVDAIGLEDTKGFCLCNAFKYIYRCTKKHGSPVEDVKKAVWYLNKYLELEGEPIDTV